METKPHKTISGNDSWSSLDESSVYLLQYWDKTDERRFFLSLSFFPKVQTEPHQNIITWRSLRHLPH